MNTEFWIFIDYAVAPILIAAVAAGVVFLLVGRTSNPGRADGFADKPHRCPVCWRVDYNLISWWSRRVCFGACRACESKWWGVRTRRGRFARAWVREYGDPTGEQP